MPDSGPSPKNIVGTVTYELSVDRCVKKGSEPFFQDKGCKKGVRRKRALTPFLLVDAHHVRHWADGGETRMDNLVLLCHRHHRLVHEGGFGVSITSDGEATFSYPDGRTLHPCNDGRFRGNVISIRRKNAASGRDICPETLSPNWRGERMDLNMVICGLQDADQGKAIFCCEQAVGLVRIRHDRP